MENCNFTMTMKRTVTNSTKSRNWLKKTIEFHNDNIHPFQLQFTANNKADRQTDGLHSISAYAPISTSGYGNIDFKRGMLNKYNPLYDFYKA